MREVVHDEVAPVPGGHRVRHGLGVVGGRLGAPRREGRRLHGTGCVLSAAITAGLALGNDLDDAVAEAKRYVTLAIETAPEIGHARLPGRGSGRMPIVPR